MTKTKIFSILMLPVVAFMSYLLVNSVYSEIEKAEDIKRSEKAVIAKLKMVREAEKAFEEKFGVYTSNWDSLIDFVKNGERYIIEKKEIIKQRDRTDPEYYKGDIIEVKIDTIGTEKVIDKIFPKTEYPDFDPEKLSYIPGTDNKQFEIFTGQIEKGILMVDVIEVVDRHPLDKTRDEKNPSRTRWPLRFGSKTDVTVSGNWE